VPRPSIVVTDPSPNRTVPRTLVSRSENAVCSLVMLFVAPESRIQHVCPPLSFAKMHEQLQFINIHLGLRRWHLLDVDIGAGNK
jgi:hypothetical protein